MYAWARDEVAIPAVRRWIEAGNDADTVAEMIEDLVGTKAAPRATT